VNYRQNLLAMTLNETTEWLVNGGYPRYRGDQLFNAVHHRLVPSFEQISELPAELRSCLSKCAYLELPTVIQNLVSSDASRKLLLELDDENRIEAVVIKHHRQEIRNRMTLCLSSQIGCPVGCSFCCSGQDGFVRNLNAGEIVSQAHALIRLEKEANVQSEGLNIVFMGMGEPLLNYQEVKRAMQILHEPKGLNISWRRITVSTAGVIPQIYRLAGEGWPINLAISLHAPDDALRSRLVPLNQKYPIAKLLTAAKDYFEVSRRRVTFEYTVIPGVNDNLEYARKLVTLLKGMPCLINLIPYNKNGSLTSVAHASSPVGAFLQVLTAGGMQASVRTSRGTGINAACGQLRSQTKKAW